MSVVIKLLEAVANNDGKTAESVMLNLTRVERNALEFYLQEAATFVRRVNKDWNESMNFPADNEE